MRGHDDPSTQVDRVALEAWSRTGGNILKEEP